MKSLNQIEFSIFERLLSSISQFCATFLNVRFLFNLIRWVGCRFCAISRKAGVLFTSATRTCSATCLSNICFCRAVARSVAAAWVLAASPAASWPGRQNPCDEHAGHLPALARRAAGNGGGAGGFARLKRAISPETPRTDHPAAAFSGLPPARLRWRRPARSRQTNRRCERRE